MKSDEKTNRFDITKLMSAALEQENKLDVSDMAPVWAQLAIAERLGELNETLRQSNQLRFFEVLRDQNHLQEVAEQLLGDIFDGVLGPPSE